MNTDRGATRDSWRRPLWLWVGVAAALAHGEVRAPGEHVERVGVDEAAVVVADVDDDALAAVPLGLWAGLSTSGATVFATMVASASYIAAPAALRAPRHVQFRLLRGQLQGVCGASRFWIGGTECTGSSTPRSPRATITASASTRPPSGKAAA